MPDDQPDGNARAIAEILQHLPHDAFRAQLRRDLERIIDMTDTVDALDHRPSGISYLHIPASDRGDQAPSTTKSSAGNCAATPKVPASPTAPAT